MTVSRETINDLFLDTKAQVRHFSQYTHMCICVPGKLLADATSSQLLINKSLLEVSQLFEISTQTLVLRSFSPLHIYRIFPLL